MSHSQRLSKKIMTSKKLKVRKKGSTQKKHLKRDTRMNYKIKNKTKSQMSFFLFLVYSVIQSERKKNSRKIPNEHEFNHGWLYKCEGAFPRENSILIHFSGCLSVIAELLLAFCSIFPLLLLAFSFVHSLLCEE